MTDLPSFPFLKPATAANLSDRTVQNSVHNPQSVALREIHVFPGSFGTWAIYDTQRKPMLSQISSEISIGIERTIRFLRENGVRIPHPAEIRTYLLNYSGLVSPLIYALQLTKAILEPSDEIELSVYRDPEDQSSYLFLEIKKETYPEDFFEKIELVRKLYRPLLNDIEGWLLVSTDFRSPPRP